MRENHGIIVVGHRFQRDISVCGACHVKNVTYLLRSVQNDILILVKATNRGDK